MFPPPSTPRRTDMPPPGCTGTTFGDDLAFRTDDDDLVVLHPGGMAGRQTCPWHGPLEWHGPPGWCCTCGRVAQAHAPDCPRADTNPDRIETGVRRDRRRRR